MHQGRTGRKLQLPTRVTTYKTPRLTYVPTYIHIYIRYLYLLSPTATARRLDVPHQSVPRSPPKPPRRHLPGRYLRGGNGPNGASSQSLHCTSCLVLRTYVASRLMPTRTRLSFHLTTPIAISCQTGLVRRDCTGISNLEAPRPAPPLPLDSRY